MSSNFPTGSEPFEFLQKQLQKRSQSVVLQYLFYSSMQMDIGYQLNNHLTTLPTHGSFSGWLKQFTPILSHLASTRQQMILSQYLYSLVSYSNQLSLKYFALVDYLIHTSPSFIRALETILQPIFVRTFVWFYQNGRLGETEQMKTFRFRWIGKINPQVLYSMKVAILNWIFVDIDARTPTNGYKQNKSAHVQAEENSKEPCGKRSRIQYSRQKDSQRPLKRRNIEQKKESVSTGSNNTEKTLTATQLKLQKLKELAPFKCKLCGKRFGQKKHHDQHQQKQMKGLVQQWRNKKLSAASNVKEVMVRQSCLQSSRWADPNPIQLKQQQHYFFLEDFAYDSQDCYFCREPFELLFLEKTEKWAYKNCVKVVLEERDCAMHKSCYDTLLGEEQKVIDS